MIDINKIYCENCVDTMSRMDAKSVDMVLTSPPYDNLRDYNGYSFDFPKVADGLIRVIKQGGIIVWVVNDATVQGSETGTSFRQALYFMDNGLNLHDTMIYQKCGCCMPSPNRYLSNFEYMFVFSKGKPKTFNPIMDRKNRFTERWGGGRVVREKDGQLIERGNYKANEYGRRFNIWKYNGGYGYGHDDKIAYEHPATFPSKLAEDHIISWSNKGDLIYDPFMGSGTTAKMAIVNGRNYIGSEISKEYCELAEKRIADYQNGRLPL